MGEKTILSKELLHNLFNYCDGVLYWKKRNGNKAGTDSGRYLQTAINKKLYGNHRLIFMMHYGYLPKNVDHINNNTYDNKIENLRKATNSQNCANAKLRKDSKTNVKNVTNCGKKYRVVLKGKHFGLFEDLELAELVATEVRNKYYGEFANHG